MAGIDWTNRVYTRHQVAPAFHRLQEMVGTDGKEVIIANAARLPTKTM